MKETFRDYLDVMATSARHFIDCTACCDSASLNSRIDELKDIIAVACAQRDRLILELPDEENR